MSHFGLDLLKHGEHDDEEMHTVYSLNDLFMAHNGGRMSCGDAAQTVYIQNLTGKVRGSTLVMLVGEH